MAQRHRCDERGVVYLEMLIAFVPVFIFFLCILQLGLLASAKLVVKHSAIVGARSAVVVLEDDPAFYGYAPRGALTGGSTNEDQAVGAFLSKMAGMRKEGGNFTSAQRSTGARLQIIRDASYFPLASLAPSPTWLLAGEAKNVESVLSSSPLARFATGLFAYNRALAIVTLRPAPGSSKVLATSVPPGTAANPQPVTVHVTYFYYCAIPIARQLVCDPGYDLIGLGKSIRELSSIVGELSSSPSLSELERANSRLRALGSRLRTQKKQAQELYSELQRAESPGMAVLYLLRGYYAPLEGEATLPNQSAGYEPRTAPPARGGKSAQGPPARPSAGASQEGANGAATAATGQPLDWSIVSKNGETRQDHVGLHGEQNLQKKSHGVFYGDPVTITNDAWNIGQRTGVVPITDKGVDIYVIPRPNSGYDGGFAGQRTNLNTVTIITQRGNNKIITAFPGNGWPPPEP